MGPAHNGEGFVLKQGLGEMVAYSEKSTLATVGGPTLVKDYVIVITQPPWRVLSTAAGTEFEYPPHHKHMGTGGASPPARYT